MAKFAMENFGGEIPAVDNRLLPDNHAAIAVNTWLLSGRIEPIHSLVSLHTMVNPAARSFFRLPIANPGVDYMTDSYWLEFESQFVRVIASPVTGQDQGSRYYWTDGVYPKYMTGDMIKNANLVPPVAPYLPLRLGVPAPGSAPGVVPSGGVSTTNQTRAYAYTWVTGLGEEGPPSPPGIATGKIDATWNVTLVAPTGAQTANRNLTHVRIYRSITSAQGVATYFFLTEQVISDLTYSDTLTDAQIVLNEQLETLGWDEPPADLEGMISLPNGMIAAWRKNEVWFCEPYHPHAWPIQYQIAVPTDIVGLGALGQAVIILTEGSPWSATGVDPNSMALAILQPLEPCTSRLSIVNTPNGVLYSSPNGLINITAGGAQNLTKDIILKDQWAETLNLDSVAAAILMGGYYAYSIATADVFQEDTFQVPDAFQQDSHYGKRPGLFISSEPRVAKTVLDPADVEVQNVITDIFNGEVMVLREDPGGSPIVYLVDVRKHGPYGKHKWRSKMFRTQYLSNLGAAKVYWTPPPGGSPAEPTVFRMYAAASSQQMEDGLWFRFEQKLGTSGQMFRLPSGFKALYFQFEIEGYHVIDAIHVASSARELRDI